VQVVLGVLAGGVATLVLIAKTGDVATARGIVLPILAPSLMLGICTAACLGPLVRALRIQPTEALRTEG